MAVLGLTVHPAYADAIRQKSESFNSRFKTLKRTHPDINPEVFSSELKRLFEAALPPAPTGAAPGPPVEALFASLLQMLSLDPSLQLPRTAAVLEAWRKIIPRLQRIFETSPADVIAIMGNGTLSVQNRGGRTGEFIATMYESASHLNTLDQVRQFTRAAGWKAGLADQRAPALDAIENLPEAALRSLFPQNNASGAEIARRWRENPWSEGAVAGQVTASAGGFAGFEGQFLLPPRVSVYGDGFLAGDPFYRWILHADAFGLTWTRTAAEIGRPEALGEDLPSTLTDVVSVARSPHTIAATITSSMRVYLVARR